MLGTVNSPEAIEKVQYFLRENGIADVFLHQNLNEEEVEENGKQFVADEVYFMITGEMASQQVIEADFDYWYECGKSLGQYELADRYSLSELRSEKLLEVNAACEGTIYAGIDIELTGGVEHFSLTEKDQLNIMGLKEKLAQRATAIEYHSDGNPCRYYTPEEMQKIITQAMEFVSYHTTYCNSLHTWIKAVAKASEAKSIRYGLQIPEEYQSDVLKDYLARMAESEA